MSQQLIFSPATADRVDLKRDRVLNSTSDYQNDEFNYQKFSQHGPAWSRFPGCAQRRVQPRCAGRRVSSRAGCGRACYVSYQLIYPLTDH
ncbi:jg9917 [Pararge aegeria aegeria]|uniref:Jg9917 protein n=1 Tax=Pararge aegeria aegeria TaxID=348720 RepID=A0A8S4RBM5_9NEOP|nr:jg9917 [Pararge aegeria aegeria]